MMQSYGNMPHIRYGDDLKIVNGRVSAEQYSMYPNSRVLLMDSTQDRFYIKETDASGMATIKSYDFVEVIETKPTYLTEEQIRELIKNELNSKQSNESISKPTTVQTKF